MRFRSLLLLPSLFLFAACGGGGTEVRTAALRGVVYELNDQTQDRSGVRVTMLETGRTVTTGPVGTFSFDGVLGGALSMRFDSTLVAIGHERGDDEADGDDAEEEREDEAEDDADDDDDGDAADEDDGDAEDEDDGDAEDADDGDVEDGEDENGNWCVHDVEDGDEVEVAVAIRNGEVVEFSCSARDRRRAEARLSPAPESPDTDVEGEVRLESRVHRERFKIEAENLEPGTIVEFFLDDPATADGPVSIGTATADVEEGEAELAFDTKHGDELPFGVASVADLAGFAIEVRLASTGELLLSGEVPGLPAHDDNEPGEPPDGDDDARGRARLEPAIAGLEGEIEIRTRPEQNRERFEMEAEGLEPGTEVAFEIEDPANPGSFVLIAVRTADEEGEAELETEGLLPLHASKVGELVGLAVRVTLADGSGTLLLSGVVPELVAD